MLKAASLRLALVCALAAPAFALPPMALPAAAQSRCGDVWRVSPGDTLSKIATACGISAGAIQRANPQIEWRRLQVGQRVNLTASASGGGRDFETARPSAGEGYVVRQGDTLSGIAAALGVALQALLEANPDLDPRSLQPGRTLYFSDGGGRPDRPRPGRPAPQRIDIRVDDRDAYPGGEVALLVSGLQPGVTISVEAEPRRGRGGAEDSARADRRGTAELLLQIDRRAREGERWDFAVLDQRGRTLGEGRFALAGSRPGRPDRPDRPPVERLQITGVISNEGVECPVLRGENGRLYSLAGNLGGYRPGDRVSVTGSVAQMSTCMQGTTIAVDGIRPAR